MDDFSFSFIFSKTEGCKEQQALLAQDDWIEDKKKKVKNRFCSGKQKNAVKNLW